MSAQYLFVEASAAPEPILSSPVILANDGFCPDIDVQDFEAKYQLDSSYSPERRQACLVQAMHIVNTEIAALVCEWLQADWLSLEAVPSSQVNNESTKVEDYRTAVYCKALQLLASRYRSTDTKEYAVPKAAAHEEAAQYWQSVYITVLHRLFGNPSGAASMELI